MTTLQTLFKKTSTGADQEWTISVEGNVIVTRFGRVGGKIQESRDEVKEGKNAGRANATTPEEQAKAEAQSQWEKKLKKGYVKSLTDARAGKVDALVTGGYWPMLAHRYDKRGDDIAFPAFLQPKLDGHRCTGLVGTEGVTLWSRKRMPILSMPHITRALMELGLKGQHRPDGELYNHAYHNKFEELTHFIKRPGPIPGHEVVQYHLYDVFIEGAPFCDRLGWLQTHIPKDHPYLKVVKTIEVADEDEMTLAFEEHNADGYEGAIIRNAKGTYLSAPPDARSVDLQKLKTFIDDEFRVVGVKEGRGKLAGHAIFQCVYEKTGVDTDVKMKGPQAELKKYFENPTEYIGRELTVKFQGWTNKGRPRFGVAWRFAEKL